MKDNGKGANRSALIMRQPSRAKAEDFWFILLNSPVAPKGSCFNCSWYWEALASEEVKCFTRIGKHCFNSPRKPLSSQSCMNMEIRSQQDSWRCLNGVTGNVMKHNSPDNTLSTLIKFYKNIFCQILTYNTILSGSSSQAFPPPSPSNLIRLSRLGT